MSYAMFQVSHVTCYVSQVMCHMSNNLFIYLFNFLPTIGEAYHLRVFYKGGLPLLVEVAKIKNMTFFKEQFFFFKIFKL